MAGKKGLLHLYYGNGKGKSTCAFGLCVRASGSGMKVLVVQFMKTGTSNEVKTVSGLDGVEVMEAPRMKKFSFDMEDDEKAEMRKENDALLGNIKEKVEGGDYDLLIMDEFVGAIQKGLLDEDKAMDLIEGRPESLEVVVTGRHPSDRLMEEADYVTEMKKVKHPYDEGIMARKGIEF